MRIPASASNANLCALDLCWLRYQIAGVRTLPPVYMPIFAVGALLIMGLSCTRALRRDKKKPLMDTRQR